MRRITVILALVLALALAWTPAALADEEDIDTITYLFEELDISIDIPDDYVVFTQDSIDASFAKEIYDMDAGAMADNMEENDIYLLANKAPNYLYEVVLTIQQDSTYDDFSLCTDDELLDIFSGFAGSYIDDYFYTYVGLYQHPQTKFVESYSYLDKYGRIYNQEYFTVHNGLELTININNYSGYVMGGIEGDRMDDMLASIDFSAATQETGAAGEGPAGNSGTPSIGEDYVLPEGYLDSIKDSLADNDYFSGNDAYLPDDGGWLKPFSWSNVIISMVVYMLIYLLPILIYRYLIRKEPLPVPQAKLIAIIYGVVVFVLIMVVSLLVLSINPLSVLTAILWSYLNYRILIAGAKPLPSSDSPIAEAAAVAAPPDRGEQVMAGSSYTSSRHDGASNTDAAPVAAASTAGVPANATEQADSTARDGGFAASPQHIAETAGNAAATREVRYCGQCGAPVPPDSVFCHKCGAKIQADYKEN